MKHASFPTMRALSAPSQFLSYQTFQSGFSTSSVNTRKQAWAGARIYKLFYIFVIYKTKVPCSMALTLSQCPHYLSVTLETLSQCFLSRPKKYNKYLRIFVWYEPKLLKNKHFQRPFTKIERPFTKIRAFFSHAAITRVPLAARTVLIFPEHLKKGWDFVTKVCLGGGRNLASGPLNLHTPSPTSSKLKGAKLHKSTP